MAERKTDGRTGGFVKASNVPLVQNIVDKIGTMPEPASSQMVTAEILVENEVIRPEDIAYTHSVFVQCFMPVRHNENNRRRWQTNCGHASMVIRAGELMKPNTPGMFKECAVPAGPKARIVAAYINDFAYRHKTPVINLADSMRLFMERAEIPIGGKNGKELQRELENFAAAEILLGVWSPDGSSASQEQTKVAQRMSFWIDKNPDQKTLWQQEMVLSPAYYKALMDGEHIAPIHWDANVKLQQNPRAMDVLNFLTYRLRKPLSKPVYLRASILHSMFGPDVKELRHFWPRFLQAFNAALKHYPAVDYQILNDALVLYNSPPLIPYKKMIAIG